MISNAKTAQQISELMFRIYRELEDSIELVRDTCPQCEYAAYDRAVGKVACPIIYEVLEPLFIDNPELKPAGWDD